MASILSNSLFKYMANGSVDFDTDTFKCMLLNNSYTPSKSHDYLNDVNSYEVSGTGYTAGGNAATPTISAVDNVNNRVEISWSIASWTTATITAAYGAIYKSRGGAASADELIGIIDFGGNKTSTAGTFTITVSTNMRFQN